MTALHSQVAELTSRVAELDRTQTHMATRLERIIFSLHNGFVDKKYADLRWLLCRGVGVLCFDLKFCVGEQECAVGR